MTTLRASETAFIVTVQRTRVARALVPAGKVLSLFGEHAAGWILLGLAGAAIDWSHAGAWLISTAAVIVAHGLSVVLKRVVRRPRPGALQGALPGALQGGAGHDIASGGYAANTTGPVKVYASAPSKLSFPSSHASSTMAACVVYTAFFPEWWPVAVVVALAMGVSRVILGMHFATDVLAGYAIGLIVGVPVVLWLH